MTLKAEKLCFSYPKGPEFKDLSLDLARGSLYTLVGANGAGKSAILRVLAGILPAHGGSLTLNGKNLTVLTPWERAGHCAYVPQELPASPMTVYETILLGRTPHLRFFPSRQDRLAVEAAMARLGIAAWRHRLQDELSGGERRRVFLGLALAQESPALLLDEPAGSLDPRHKMEIYALLRDLCREENKLILSAEHDLNLAARYADTILAVHGGKVMAQGSPGAVLTPDLLRVLYGIETLAQTITVSAGPGETEERPQILNLDIVK